MEACLNSELRENRSLSMSQVLQFWQPVRLVTPKVEQRGIRLGPRTSRTTVTPLLVVLALLASIVNDSLERPTHTPLL